MSADPATGPATGASNAALAQTGYAARRLSVIAKRMMDAPAQPYPLTRRQMELLIFIGGYIEAYRVAPTFDAMRDGIGLPSKGDIHRMLGQLESRGHIRRMAYTPRAIEVLSNPPIPRAPDGAPCVFIPADRLVWKDLHR